MTRLTELMSEGYHIQISEFVTPGTVFPYIDADHETTMVFHPFDYSYISNDDIFKAHEINMLRIYNKIDAMAEAAISKLDQMVYEMEHKHDPKVVAFMPNVVVTENEDGTFTFQAKLGDHVFAEEEQESTADYLKGIFG